MDDIEETQSKEDLEAASKENFDEKNGIQEEDDSNPLIMIGDPPEPYQVNG